MRKQKGKAYAFFQNPSSEEALRQELPAAKEMAQLPAGMTVNLNRIGDLRGEPALMQVKADALSYQNTHVLVGGLPDGTNQQTAQQLADVVAMLCNNPALYQRGQQFVGGIVYWDAGERDYVMLDSGF